MTWRVSRRPSKASTPRSLSLRRPRRYSARLRPSRARRACPVDWVSGAGAPMVLGTISRNCQRSNQLVRPRMERSGRSMGSSLRSRSVTSFPTLRCSCSKLTVLLFWPEMQVVARTPTWPTWPRAVIWMGLVSSRSESRGFLLLPRSGPPFQRTCSKPRNGRTALSSVSLERSARKRNASRTLLLPAPLSPMKTVRPSGFKMPVSFTALKFRTRREVMARFGAFIARLHGRRRGRRCARLRAPAR